MEVGLGGLQLGPLVLAWGRLFALVAVAVVLAAAGWLARRDSDLAGWGWAAVIAGGLGGRIVFVGRHWAAFAAEPWTVVAFWQGGFDPWGAVAGAIGLALWRYRARAVLRRALVPVLAGLGVWLLLVGAHAGLAPTGPRLPAERWPALAGSARLAPEGGPAVINLWASWCPPCRREMPRLAEAAANHPRVAFAFVNQGEDRPAVNQFSRRFGLDPGRVFLDPARRLAGRFGTVGLPATLFFTADGRLAAVHVGEISRAALADRVQSLKRH